MTQVFTGHVQFDLVHTYHVYTMSNYQRISGPNVYEYNIIYRGSS